MFESIKNNCQQFLFDGLLDKWSKNGLHPQQHYSFESLHPNWHANSTGRLRLLTQCRQLYTFSHAYHVTQDSKWYNVLTPLFDFICQHYWHESRWYFSLNDDLSVLDKRSDTYTLAFVLLAFSHYFQASHDDRALALIQQTHQFLTQQLNAENGGFYESYPIDRTALRRQNPHMHLLEGYIAAYNITQDRSYLSTIKSLLALAKQHFYDESNQCLLEFFQPNWHIDPNIGHQIEPGHHFEWVWLLHQAHRLEPDPSLLALAEQLWQTATQYGFDPSGGLYNQIDAISKQPLDREKRIWPLTEYLKALCVHANDETVRQQLPIVMHFAFDRYFKPDSSWNEYLDHQNQPKDFPLPGTSSYHIFLGLLEVIRWIDAQQQ